MSRGTLVTWKVFVSPETISHPDGSEDMENLTAIRRFYGTPRPHSKIFRGPFSVLTIIAISW